MTKAELIHEEMQAQLQELLELVKQDEQYAAPVDYGAVKADQDTAQAHQQRTVRIIELKRNYGLK